MHHLAVRESFTSVLWVNIKPNKLLSSVLGLLFVLRQVYRKNSPLLSISTENPPGFGFLWRVIMLMCENKHMVGSLPCIRVWEALLCAFWLSTASLSSCSHSLNARWTLLCIMTWQSFASAAETSASLIHVLLMIYHLPLSHTCTGLRLSTWLTSSLIHLNWGSCRLVEGKYKVVFNEVRPHKTKPHIKEIQSQGVLIHSFSTQQHHFLFSFIPLLPPHRQPEWLHGPSQPGLTAHCSSLGDSLVIKWVRAWL